jgi:hypothetical protein
VSRTLCVLTLKSRQRLCCRRLEGWDSALGLILRDARARPTEVDAQTSERLGRTPSPRIYCGERVGVRGTFLDSVLVACPSPRPSQPKSDLSDRTRVNPSSVVRPPRNVNVAKPRPTGRGSRPSISPYRSHLTGTCSRCARRQGYAVCAQERRAELLKDEAEKVVAAVSTNCDSGGPGSGAQLSDPATTSTQQFGLRRPGWDRC